MPHKDTIEKLIAARDALDIALDALLAEVASEDRDQQGVCKYCRLPIYAGDELLREIHRACYHRAYSLVSRGMETWKTLEAKGLVGPEGQPGRKRLPMPSAVDRRNYVPDPAPPKRGDVDK